MPYIRVDPDVFLAHKGVEVFYVYDTDGSPWRYWFTTDPDHADDGHHKSHFDARLFVGKWSEAPNTFDWEEWWKPRFRTEDEAIKALVQTAIDEGKVRARPEQQNG